MKKKALLFDFDGVLLDSEPLHFLAWNKTLEKLHLKDPAFTKENVIGVSDLSLAEHFLQKFPLKLSSSELLEKKRHEFLYLVQCEDLRATEEERVLSLLQKDYLMAIVSSSHSDEIEHVLTKLNLRSFFSLIIAGNHVKHHKPHPEPYLKALCDLNLNSSEAMVIEDSLPGMQSALSAHLPVIWLNRYQIPTPSFKNIIPIHTFQEIPEALPFI